MNANTFGTFLRLTTFGESHGPCIGGILDGIPAGLEFDEPLLKDFMNRRRPGQNDLVSGRQESDEVEIMSGIYKNFTLGTPIGFRIPNKDARSQDYENFKVRVGHADDLWKEKFGHSDPRGGGRASGRETATRVVGGAFAKMLLRELNPEIQILAFASALGPFQLDPDEMRSLTFESIEKSKLRFPAKESKHRSALELIESAKQKGESWGGRARVRISRVPAGWGQPVFKKLKSDLAQAMLSVGATYAFEMSAENESAPENSGSKFHENPHSEHYAGLRGGISTGDPITFQVSFKPTSTRNEQALQGRHDPCIVPRAVPVCEAMSWLVLADHALARRLDKLK